MLSVGSLFSGIGGFDLGFERAGMRTLWFCEQSEFCQRVLAKNFPGVPCYSEVRALVADAEREPPGHGTRAARDVPGAAGEAQGEGLQRQRGRDTAGDRGADGSGVELAGGDAVPVPVPYVDVLCGGFPCQDLSVAGHQAGLDGARSGLWSEMFRLACELRPRYVVVENVSALLTGDGGAWMRRVLGDLAQGGFDAEWDCIPASAVGAPHRRDRIWIVAYPSEQGLEGRTGPDAARPPLRVLAGGRRSVGAGEVGDADSAPQDALAAARASRPAVGERGGWAPEPDVGRVADGIPDWVDRLRALGNALVPQIPELIGRRILDYEEGRLAHAA